MALMKSPHKYQKVGLKSSARISEWEMEIGQGIPRIRNLRVPGKPLKIGLSNR